MASEARAAKSVFAEFARLNHGSHGAIENRHYRIRIDPAGGGLLEFFDKALEHDFAGTYQGWRPGQYVYETVDSKDGRLAIANIDFSHPDFFVGSKNTPWLRRIADKVEIDAPKIEEGRASITVRIVAPGVSAASVTFALDAGTKSLAIDWTLEKLHHEDPEAVFVAFPFKLDKPRFTIDLNGIPSAPNDDQLDGAAKDWYPLQRWVDVSDGMRGVTLVPHDAPLVHLSGITTGKWSRRLEPEARDEIIGTVHREAKRLSALIDDFLDVQAIEQDRLSLGREPFSLTELLEEQVGTFAGQSATHSLRLAFICRIFRRHWIPSPKPPTRNLIS